jgi:hypothetical protein
MSTDSPAVSRRGPRLAGEIKNVRAVKGGRWQARFYDCDSGKRFNLGVYPTEGRAERAVRDFVHGRLRPRLKYAREVDDRAGNAWWIAVVALPRWLVVRYPYRARRVRRGWAVYCRGRRTGPFRTRAEAVARGRQLARVAGGSHRVGGRFGSAEDAHAAAAAWVRARVGRLGAWWLIEGAAG